MVEGATADMGLDILALKSPDDFMPGAGLTRFRERPEDFLINLLRRG